MSNCKYYKQKRQVSYNSGQTWSDVSPAVYQIGNLYEMDSMDCSHGSSQIRWVVVPGDFLCEGKNKYEKEIEQYSIDGGETWMNVYPTTYRKGRLIESDSNVCDNKWEGHYIDVTNYDPITPTPPPTPCPKWYKWVDGVGCVYVDPVKFVRCSTSSSTTLTSDDVNYHPYKLIYGTIGDCVTTIGQYTFNQSSITDITIPSGVTLIDWYAFRNCGDFETCIINGNTTSGTVIANHAFEYCASLSNLTIGSGVTSIGDYSFFDCFGLTNIDLPDTITSIGNYAFYQCSGLTSVTIPSGSIGNQAFQYCSGLTYLELGSGVTSIGKEAFEFAHRLSGEITIPDSVTSIGAWAFAYCEEITDLVIGSGVTSIGGGIVEACSGLTSITCLATTPPNIVASFDYANECPIYVPCESLGRYLSEWSQYASRIEGIPPCEAPILYKIEATYLDSSTYNALCSGTSLSSGDTRPNGYTYTAMTSAVIGPCVTTIGNSAFDGFTSLSSVTIPNSVASIGTYAFHNDSSLIGVTIPNGVSSIMGGTFAGCTSLGSVNIPNECTIIRDYAFQDCFSLSNILIPNSVTAIGASAFENCSGLTQVSIGSGVTAIDNQAFQNCSSLTSIDIPSGVTYIRSGTFINCSGLTSVTIPNTVIDIGISSFGGCSNLTGVTIPNSVRKIDGGAFENCSGITTLTFGTGLTNIENGAFSNCASISSLTIPDNVAYIGNNTFEKCSGMTTLTIGSGVTTIGHHAFSGCSVLTSITCLATTPPTLEKNFPYGQSYAFNNTNNCPIYVPSGSVNTYKNASEWSRYSSRIQAIP